MTRSIELPSFLAPQDLAPSVPSLILPIAPAAGTLMLPQSIAVVVGGVVLADMLRPLGAWQYGFTWFATGFWLSVWVVRTTWMDT